MEPQPAAPTGLATLSQRERDKVWHVSLLLRVAVGTARDRVRLRVPAAPTTWLEPMLLRPRAVRVRRGSPARAARHGTKGAQLGRRQQTIPHAASFRAMSAAPGVPS